MKVGLKVNRFELEISDDNVQQVKYSVEGAWHKCTLLEFITLLAGHFKPAKQEVGE